MKRSVFRYPIEPDTKHICVPVGSKILSIAYWKGEVSAWVEQDANDDPGATQMNLPIYIVGTGEALPEEAKTYIDSVRMHDLELVWHFYTK